MEQLIERYEKVTGTRVPEHDGRVYIYIYLLIYVFQVYIYMRFDLMDPFNCESHCRKKCTLK
jgi:hypothetical protein